MRSGTPLTDEDRGPWLEAVARWIGEQEAAGRSAIVTCSALKRAYREVLRRDHPSVWFVHVSSSPDALQHRLATRSGHYMPASLLASQLETLEPLEPDEPASPSAARARPTRSPLEPSMRWITNAAFHQGASDGSRPGQTCP